MGLRRRTFSTPSRTFVRATASTYAAFLLDFVTTERGRGNGRLDSGQQAGEVSHLHVVDRTLDRATGRMPEQQDDLGASNRARELQAAEQVVVDHVTGNPGVERVANAGVEDDLGWCARVDAPEHHGSRELTRGAAALLIAVVVREHLSR